MADGVIIEAPFYAVFPSGAYSTFLSLGSMASVTEGEMRNIIPKATSAALSVMATIYLAWLR